MEFIFQIFVLFGTCSILKYGKILNPIRDFLTKKQFFKDLFTCSMCLGFWVGLFWGMFWVRPFYEWAFFSSAVCWIMDYLVEYLENRK